MVLAAICERRCARASSRSTARSRRAARPRPGAGALLVLGAALAAGCGSGGYRFSSSGRAAAGAVVAVGAENQYADVIAQVGGPYVKVAAIESNPNTDPHSFEASPSVAQLVASARLVVQNGVGYDTFMERVESASPSSARKVLDVQRLLGLPDSTPNPHLWYRPDTMAVLAAALAADLSALEPVHAAYFRASASRFERSLAPWYLAIRQFAKAYPGAAVASAEPVADYMLQAAGTRDLSPFGLQADTMNGLDPAAQDVTRQRSLFSRHEVKAFIYNEQVTDSLTHSFLETAMREHVPVVAVYETMPTDGYDYQSWMLAEVRALREAVADGVSTPRL